jgi:hypothetical protein
MQATRVTLPWVAAFISSSFEKRTKLRVSNYPERKGFRNQFRVELKNAYRKGLGDLSQAATANGIQAKSIESTPFVWLKASCVSTQNCRPIPGQIE